MPLFSSRRKSEANLRASSSPEQPPLPNSTANLASALRGQQASRSPRSRSASRTDGKRPERERSGPYPPPMPQKGARQSTGGSSGEGWVVLDGTAAPQPPRKDSYGAGPSTPIAARFSSSSVSASARRGFETPPRRDSSFASSSSAFNTQTSPSTFASANLVASPSFFSSTPPTSDGGHDGFSLDGGSIPAPAALGGGGHHHEHTPTNGISQTFGVHDSPSSSFVQRGSQGGASTALEHDHRAQVATSAGLPPSSSFYNFNGVASPPRTNGQRESFQRRNGNGSFPVSESEESPSKGGSRRVENVSAGSWTAHLRRESLQATRAFPWFPQFLLC
jgi:hypothetical protein